MNNMWRTIVTLIMWAALSTVSIVVVSNSFISDYGDFAMVLMTLVPLALAMGGTAALWQDVIQGKGGGAASVGETSEKAKRAVDDKLALLMNMMDDDEREAFKERLKREVIANMRLSDEGELPAGLDNLLNDDRQPSR